MAAHGFELARTDHDFHFDESLIDDATVVVTRPKVAEPVAVRYDDRNASAAG